MPTGWYIVLDFVDKTFYLYFKNTNASKNKGTLIYIFHSCE